MLNIKESAYDEATLRLLCDKDKDLQKKSYRFLFMKSHPLPCRKDCLKSSKRMSKKVKMTSFS